jgi:hypothetical protein
MAFDVALILRSWRKPQLQAWLDRIRRTLLKTRTSIASACRGTPRRQLTRDSNSGSWSRWIAIALLPQNTSTLWLAGGQNEALARLKKEFKKGGSKKYQKSSTTQESKSI